MNDSKNLSRKNITERLVQVIESWPFSIACWEGGSAANQRVDQYSDIDLQVCVEDQKSNEALALILDCLNSVSKIEHYWRVPEPTWHGNAQCFIKLSGTPEYFFLDIVVMEAKTQQRFLERERHGTPIVYFDKKQFVKTSSADTNEFWTKRLNRLEIIEASFPFYKVLVLKEVLRNRPLDAMAFYRTLVSLLVELLGMKYRPLRFDFGLRYLHTDLPLAEQMQLEKFCFVADLNQIQSFLPELETQALKLIAELKSHEKL